MRTAIRSPNTVAFVERFIQSIGQECLDHFVVFGHKHMDVLCSSYRDHYHLERPHQGKDNELLVTAKNRKRSSQEPETIRLVDIHRKDRLGGLLKSYSRKLLSDSVKLLQGRRWRACLSVCTYHRAVA